MLEIPFLLFGVGGVGRSLLQQILDQRTLHSEEYGIRFQAAALCDSRSAAIADGELTDGQIQTLLTLKASGSVLSDHPLGEKLEDPPTILARVRQPNLLVIDCTATDATEPALLNAVDNGFKVVLANKIPLTSSQEAYDRLTRAGVTNGPRNLGFTRWETTVGAGLPVIATLNRLVASGDEITRMAGTFSGTLGYVMTGLQEGKLLSEIVREAHELGYTEPDPRDDLGGVDVARKALILARGLGWQLDLEGVSIEGLYPPEMDSLSVPEFLEALPTLDEEFQKQVQAAAVDGKVLRYAAQVEDGKCRVGPAVVERESPLGRLSGTDNLIEFYSRWYSPNPLVIQGRGAGVEATAAGVLSDMVELASLSA